MNSKCDHCAQKVIIPIRHEDKTFCCEGCKTVFTILKEHKLDSYYSLRETSGKETFATVEETNQKYQYLDHAEFLNKYAHKEKKYLKMAFYLENIHCVACLWLIEKLPSFEIGVIGSRLNMSKSTVEITIDERTSFSKIAKKLEVLGYPPHPILEDGLAKKLQEKEDQKDLIRIAISFFCTGNIMLLAFSVYAGAEGIIKQYFDWISFFLFLPVALYTAKPFYISAFLALKNRVFSIDLPIVIALLLGGSLSFINVLDHGKHIYFDSLTTLIFLLLTSRFILKKSQQKGLAASEISNFFTNIIANRIDAQGNEEEVFANFLEIDDKILIKPGETIPTDSRIYQGESSTNNSLITGEILPQKVKVGDMLFSGTVNLDQNLYATVLKSPTDSKLGQILSNVEKGWNKKTKIMTISDKIAHYFVSIVLSIAILVFLYWLYLGNPYEAFIRSLTLIIITCPCALGLATPLSLTLTLARLAKLGIIIKDELVIEQTNLVKNIFFDKTGTLTQGKFQVTKWEELTSENHASIIYALESKTTHPIAKSIIQYLRLSHSHEIKELKLENYEEILAKGPRALYNDTVYEIKPITPENNIVTAIGLFRDKKLVTKIFLEDGLKENAAKIISKLQSMNFNIKIVSGDNEAVVSKIASELKISPENTYSQMKPDDKLELVKNSEHVMMLGDGANDAMSLSSADVGVAVHGSVDISLRASNVFITDSNLDKVFALIIASKETINLIKRNLIFSLFYNIIGCTLALLGLISPLLAAILMPLSSLTVLLSTVWGTKQLRHTFK